MYENFSPVVFLYGLALVLAIGKAFTLTIWRTLPKRRPGLRQEMFEAWQRRRARRLTGGTANLQVQNPPTAEASPVEDNAQAVRMTDPVAPPSDKTHGPSVVTKSL